MEVVNESWTGEEQLFNTPSAIARVWRADAFRQEMVVSVERTRDPNMRPLTFRWALLRGDPARTLIQPLDPQGRRARIAIEWQAPRAAPGRADVLSPRIDIGVFANNGAHDSAPAFISVLLPWHERRTYDNRGDGGWHLKRTDLRALEGIYVDPLVFPKAQ